MLVTPHTSVIYYALLAFCLLLGVGVLILAWRRPRKRQRGLRMLAGALAAAALWLLVFPPLRPLPAARAEAILLTDGYAPDTLRQLLRRLGAGTSVWTYGTVTPPDHARPLVSLLDLTEQKPALRRLHIVGHGLPAADLPLLKNVALTLHSGRAFAGFATAFWPEKLALGQTLRVEGTVAAPANDAPAWVCLRAAGAVRDSVRLQNGSGAFRLHYLPKTSGLALYELLLRRDGQPLVTEPVPVEITTSPLPVVLLLAAVPSFEFKFLKNYLAEAHYPVALRTAVSRGLVQTDFVNQPAQTLDQLTPSLLAHYPIVVADAATMAALSDAENQALKAAVNAGRLGLITLAEATPLPRKALAQADFTVLPRATAPTTLQPLSWAEAPGAARALLPAHLQARPALRPIATGPNQLILAASRRVGMGFAVVSTVPETFRWALRGQQSLYASFWTTLLGAARPPAPAAASWRIGSRWPKPRQPLILHLAGPMTPALPTVAALAGGPATRLALRQDTRLPEWSTAQFWPGAAGWHQVRGPGRTAYNFYVYPAEAWAGPEIQERHEAALQLEPLQQVITTNATDTVMEPWPASWFFGLFLLAAGYLWLEEKL